MDFSLSAEHQITQKTIREFAVKEIAPVIKDADRRQEPIPWLLPRMAGLGLLGLCVPTRNGGQGMDYIALGLACEELEAIDSHVRVVLSVHLGLCAMSLLQWGNEDQKQEWLKPLAQGKLIGCGAFTEPGMGSDLASMRTTAKRDGTDYVLTGEKMWISLASRADVALITVRTDAPTGRPSDGLSTFILDLKSPGVTRGDIQGKLGVRAGSTGWINLAGVRVPKANLLGEEGEGFKVTMSAFDHGRYTVAAGAAGIIRASLEASVRYAKTRTTFGKPLHDHELIQQKIAQMAQDHEIARLLYLQVGWLLNQGARATRQTSYAKKFATEAAFAAASEAIQIHGAYGYSDEFDVERHMRNARGTMIYEGSSEIQSLIQAGYAVGSRLDNPLRRELPAYKAEDWQ